MRGPGTSRGSGREGVPGKEYFARRTGGRGKGFPSRRRKLEVPFPQQQPPAARAPLEEARPEMKEGVLASLAGPLPTRSGAPWRLPTVRLHFADSNQSRLQGPQVQGRRAVGSGRGAAGKAAAAGTASPGTSSCSGPAQSGCPPSGRVTAALGFPLCLAGGPRPSVLRQPPENHERNPHTQ